MLIIDQKEGREGREIMKKEIMFLGCMVILLFGASMGLCAYHHEGEMDAGRFLAVYPEKAGAKLDHCSLCHTGGKDAKNNSLGSCQYCHYKYGYDGHGNIADTLNGYGKDYLNYGRSSQAIRDIAGLDSDGDTYSNINEINADRFPGDSSDDPSKVPAPFRVYTRAQLEAMSCHTEFLLLNTSRSGDFYAEYSGIPMEELLKDAGMDANATAIRVYAPDGFATDHPLDPDPAANIYHVRGIYPEAVYEYNDEADQAKNPVSGWCDYRAPSCKGRNHLDPIVVPGGLKMILAYKREGAYLDPGVLNLSNKLDGEGPLRVVPPQKVPCPPDQLSTSSIQNVVWPYVSTADHNAGFSSRSVTIIKVLPLPAGTTDINVYEAGWNYVDQNKIVIYGAIDPADSNGNGVLDSEEGTSDPDPKTARVRQANGAEKIVVKSSGGALRDIQALNHDDPTVTQTGKPAMAFPYGVTKFNITGLTPGDSVTVTLAFPGNVPTSAKYYKVSPTGGWQEIPFGSNDGDNSITLTLKDGDPLTDADGVANGIIVDPGALATTSSTTSSSPSAAVSGGGGGGCLISMLESQAQVSPATAWLGLVLISAFVGFVGFRMRLKR
jgi:hypothetical protein